MSALRLGRLQTENRATVSEMLEAAAVFSDDEISVALELFDEVHGVGAVAGPDYEFVGAFDEERLLGYGCFGPTPQTDGTFDLYWLVVHPSAQRRGVGRALVQWVEEELAARGARLLVVETSSREDYRHTREFYTRSGYGEAARVRDFYAPADDRIIFTTSLSVRERGVATR